ncbi:MAG: terminase small subunit [Acutalibacteraceae bacterium]
MSGNLNAKGLTNREKNFCLFYVLCGNAFEAAAQVGYPNPQTIGANLIFRKDIADEIQRLSKIHREALSGRACVGYERLAFGGIADAIRLMYCENPLNENLNDYDLFNVAEIKRMKDNTMEMKFFDRLKALEKLSQIGEEESGTTAFYKALNAQTETDEGSAED